MPRQAVHARQLVCMCMCMYCMHMYLGERMPRQAIHARQLVVAAVGGLDLHHT